MKPLAPQLTSWLLKRCVRADENLGNGFIQGAWMYQSRAAHLLTPQRRDETGGIDAALWALWVAIGEYWQLGDDPQKYRLRLRTFMDNRITINPLYDGYFAVARSVISELITQHGSPKGFEVLFQVRAGSGVPQSPIEATKRFVVDEFIAIRLALGGFQNFGATNYCGYFGGANIAEEPVPYRTLHDLT